MIRGRVIAYFRFSKWRPSAILDFKIFKIFVKNSNYPLFLRRRAKFGEDRTIHGRVIARFRFSKWRPSAILDLVWRYVGPPRLVFDGPNILLYYTLIVFILCKISRFSYSAALAWNCLFRPLFGEFLGDITPNEFLYCRNPQKDRPWAKTRRMSHKPCKSVNGFDLGA